jgi:hypothetical protein
VIFTEPTMHVISSSELAVSRSPEELEGRPIQSAILLCRLHSPSYPLRVLGEHQSTSRISKASSTAGRQPLCNKESKP